MASAQVEAVLASEDDPFTAGEIVVDARGHRCPTPTLRLRRAAEHAPTGAMIRLLANDPMAKIDVPHFASQAGLTLLEKTETDGVLSFLLTRS